MSTTSTEIAERTEPKMGMMDWVKVKGQASLLLKSGILPPTLRTVEQVMAVAATGKEIGLDIMQSVRNIDVIRGQVSMKPRLMLALALSRGLVQDFSFEKSDQKAVFKVLRKGMKSPHTETFTMEQAKRMGLVGKDNWNKQPDTMLLWRAVSAGMNLIFPDVLFGMPTPEEVGAEVMVSESDPLSGEVVPQVHEPEVVEPQEKSEDISQMIAEINDKLLKMSDGDEELANNHLRQLTTYKAKDTGEEKFLQMMDLHNVGQHRPQWIKGVLKKVNADYEKVFDKDGNKI